MRVLKIIAILGWLVTGVCLVIMATMSGWDGLAWLIAAGIAGIGAAWFSFAWVYALFFTKYAAWKATPPPTGAWPALWMIFGGANAIALWVIVLLAIGNQHDQSVPVAAAVAVIISALLGCVCRERFVCEGKKNT